MLIDLFLIVRVVWVILSSFNSEKETIILMKIGEALQELNMLKSQLSRLQSQRNRLFRLTEEDDPEYTFDELTEKIISKLKQINDIKFRIQVSNLSKRVSIEGEEMSLLGMIFKLGIVRSELSQLNEMIDNDRSSFIRLSMDRDVKKYVPISQVALEQKILKLEKSKRLYNLIIQSANWSEDLE